MEVEQFQHQPSNKSSTTAEVEDQQKHLPLQFWEKLIFRPELVETFKISLQIKIQFYLFLTRSED